MEKKLCVFDLDGTLVNSIFDIAAAMNEALSEMGLNGHETEKYYKMIGDGMEMLCRRALPEGYTESKLNELLRLYKEKYLRNCCVKTKAYDGICEMLDALSQAGVLAAVLSNKPHEQTERVVNTLFQNIEFFEVLGQSERFRKKPAPDALKYIIGKSGVDKNDVFYVGDSDVDMILAKNAGVKAVGACWGFRGKDELLSSGADLLANNADDVKKFVLDA